MNYYKANTRTTPSHLKATFQYQTAPNTKTTIPFWTVYPNTQEEKTAIKKVLADFAKNPLAYDLNEMVPDDDMREMAQVCENLCKELCE
ncbi:MAG: hypothetical protein HFJ05_01445 [Eubacterium sp.]|nr:hypothetical protein [Eubacterium sp.]